MHGQRRTLRLAAASLAVAVTAAATAQLHTGDVAIDVVDGTLWVGDIQAGVPVV